LLLLPSSRRKNFILTDVDGFGLLLVILLCFFLSSIDVALPVGICVWDMIFDFETCVYGVNI
jgi:hypothetical protein